MMRSRTLSVLKIITDSSVKRQIQYVFSCQRKAVWAVSAGTAVTIALAFLISPRFFSSCDESLLKDDDTVTFELFLADLQGILSSDDIDLDEEERKQRGKPWNSYHKVDSYPMIIVSPNSTEQV